MGKFINITGRVFGKLTVLFPTGSKSANGGYIWLCQCECGRITNVVTDRLKSGKTRSCGCRIMEARKVRTRDLTGHVFGRWTVLGLASDDVSGRVIWLCLCECGKKRAVLANSLRRGLSISCGCFHREITATINAKHQLYKSPEYRSWQCMIARCTNPKRPEYPSYGGRGIQVCNRWRQFEHFYHDMGPKLSKYHSIDRMNNNAHYSCGKCSMCTTNDWSPNCRWATRSEQQRNRRTNHLITFGNKTKTVTAWAEQTGIHWVTIITRIKRGWSIEKALTTPCST